MEIDIVTKKDLQQFKQEMLEEMRSILSDKKVGAKDRLWRIGPMNYMFD